MLVTELVCNDDSGEQFDWVSSVWCKWISLASSVLERILTDWRENSTELVKQTNTHFNKSSTLNARARSVFHSESTTAHNSMANDPRPFRKNKSQLGRACKSPDQSEHSLGGSRNLDVKLIHSMNESCVIRSI